jgi:capsular exopolysaccharide synthesis family protein
MHEGKSLIIANLAVAFAQEGRRVMLLECNLRLPTLEGIFGLRTEAGLENILAGECGWRDCVQTVSDMALGRFTMDDLAVTPGLDNLSLISFGRHPLNPSELLGSPAMTRLLAELRENFDLILIDAPPMLPVADTLILARDVDGIVVVYRAGLSPRASLRLCLERLQVLDTNILGIVLNDVHPREADRSFPQLGGEGTDMP